MTAPEQLDLLDWLAMQPPSLPQVALAPAPDPTARIEDPVLLTRVDPTCNMRRFYSLTLASGLFGETGVVRHWGRIGTSGRSRTDWYDGRKEAQTALAGMVGQKQRRGYRPSV